MQVLFDSTNLVCANTIAGMSVGERISIARQRAGLTPEMLADTLGITSEAVRAWERGGSQPRAQRYPAIAEACNSTVAYIATGEGPVTQSADAREDELAKEFATVMLSLKEEHVSLLLQFARELQKVP